MLPTAGKSYALNPPYLAVHVIAVEGAWVHLVLNRTAEREGCPSRIKLKHWARHKPRELTPALREEIADMAARLRESGSSALAQRSEELEVAVEAVKAPRLPRGGMLRGLGGGAIVLMAPGGSDA